MNLLPQNTKPTKISEKEELFLSNLFSNGGQVVAAAVDAGYVKGSVGWLRNRLADEIIKRSKNLLASASVKATQRLINTIDSPEVNRGDDLRLKAAESLLNRVGLGKEETHNNTKNNNQYMCNNKYFDNDNLKNYYTSNNTQNN